MSQIVHRRVYEHTLKYLGVEKAPYAFIIVLEPKSPIYAEVVLSDS